MPSLNKLPKHATTIRDEARTEDRGEKTIIDTVVRFHETDVVRFNNEEITLNTGGWFTATTKTRMNQASNVYGLGYRVYQKNGEWKVNIGNRLYTFGRGENILTFPR